MPSTVYSKAGADAKFGPLAKVAATVTANGAAVVNKHNPVDATGGAKTLTLPTGQAEGTQIGIEKTDASTNTVSVSGSIRGVGGTTIPLSFQSESLTLRADSGGSWWPVAGHRTKTSLDAAYASTSAPIVVQYNGSAWPTYDTSTTRIRIFMSVAYPSATAPTAYNANDIWYDGAA